MCCRYEATRYTIERALPSPGDLLRALKAARERGDMPATSSLGWYARGQHIALDIARGLAYLHSRRVVHLVCVLG